MAINKLKLITSAALPLLMFFYSQESIAQEWIPENPSDVILNYDRELINLKNKQPSQQNLQSLLNESERLILESKFPGASQKLITAKKMLTNVDQDQLSDQQRDQYLLSQANIAQSEHAFEQSLKLLEQVDNNSIYYPQTRLIAARIYIIQNQLTKAEQQCRELLSYNLPASELCLVEVKVHQKEFDTAQSSINRLAQRYDKQNSPLAQYFTQIRGSMHRLKNNHHQAQESFSVGLESAPVSQWYQWTDMAFDNDAANDVYRKLQNLQQNKSLLEDGLLIRLARAEQLTEAGQYYQQLAAERIELRQLRKDTIHAADIAYYYTHVSPNAELALQWAELNWNHAKEPADKDLLQQAQTLNH